MSHQELKEGDILEEKVAGIGLLQRKSSTILQPWFLLENS